jgi:hypothetical protein
MGLFRRTPDPAEIERMKADVAALRDDISAQMAALDARVTSVSVELANQLTELGHELDALGGLDELGKTNGHDVNEEVVGELRQGQVKLANEQARYQIAFREDLARLAEHVAAR